MLSSEWNVLKKEEITFLNKLKNELNLKYSNLFKSSLLINTSIPKSFEEIITKYNNLVKGNNSEDISRFKKFSSDLLRFDLIYTYIENFKLNSIYDNIKDLEKQNADLNNQTNEVDSKITELDNKISLNLCNIQEQVEFTKSEKILATNINKKLNLYVSFQLEHFEIDSKSHKGYYRIKNKENLEDEYREIGTLSEGEKNIIGFLYFIEKLNEISVHQKDKIIIFDDPMDSNDEMMQYIIITEIQELMKFIDNSSTKDILIVMTHNAHFYINVKYNRLYTDGQDRYGRERKSDQFIRLEKCNNKTNIKTIKSEGEDFATSYELLWKELYFLYDNNKPELMLNSIRRIIETFMKFNKKYDFYNNQREAQKLFNVNSHSIDDLEADINGKSREQLYDLMRECFITNGYSDHFKLHWRQAKK